MEIIALFAWLGFSVLVGGMAASRGRSAVGWVFVALMCSPLLAIVFLYLSPDLAEEQSKAAERERAEAEYAERVRTEELMAEQARLTEAAKITGTAFATSLIQLEQLRAHGMFADEEYASRKAQLIADLGVRTITEAPEVFLTALVPLMSNGTLTTDDALAIKRIVLPLPAPSIRS